MRKHIHPHRNPIDAMLLPSIAGGKGGAASRASAEQQPQQWAVSMGSQGNSYGAFEENEVLLILFYFIFAYAVHRKSQLSLGGVVSEFSMS